MKWFRKYLGLLPALVEAVLAKPDTVAYPFAPLELPTTYRGMVMIHAENCIGCRLCVRDCPAMALALTREDRAHFQLLHYPARCTSCGQCQLSCLHDAIYLTNQFVPATVAPVDLKKVLKDTLDESAKND